jgi:transketolase
VTTKTLQDLATLIRYYILVSTTEAGSGHPTSSLSPTDLMTVLFFGGFFRYDLKKPDYPNNDRLIFSKGHASPLFYSLYAAAGIISEKKLKTLRKFGSPLEGHPTMEFPYTEAATGSLGQGLSVGVGMAINAKYVDKLPYRTYVLLGDSEMAEGSIWEAIQLASYYKLDNLIAILDLNRLGQRGETMYGHNIKAYQKRIDSFDWSTITIDGHDYLQINQAYRKALKAKGRPTMIIAKTIKGKGVSFLENQDGWHGKSLSVEQLEVALAELGKVDRSLKGSIVKPPKAQIQNAKVNPFDKLRIDAEQSRSIKTQNYIAKFQIDYPKDKPLATRKAYGNALARLYPKYPNIVALDAEVSNSTYADIFQKSYPERFFEMYIAEQNMVGAALGLSRRGKIPFVSTFAAFFTRAFDQIRMCQYSKANIKFVGSHAGVSIGQDGASQMGLEDIAMFRSLLNSVVLYPSDAISTEKLVDEAAWHQGIVYLRTTRAETPILYDLNEKFPIGGSKIVKQSAGDVVTVVTAGLTLFEAIAAYSDLVNRHIFIRLIDLYCIKPIDIATLKKAAQETMAIITVEDHFAEGGLGEAVMNALADSPTPIYQLAVRKMPRSGQPQELLDYEGISKRAIIKKVLEII